MFSRISCDQIKTSATRVFFSLCTIKFSMWFIERTKRKQAKQMTLHIVCRSFDCMTCAKVISPQTQNREGWKLFFRKSEISFPESLWSKLLHIFYRDRDSFKRTSRHVVQGENLHNYWCSGIRSSLLWTTLETRSFCEIKKSRWKWKRVQ